MEDRSLPRLRVELTDFKMRKKERKMILQSRFEFVSQIGQGAFGKVFLGRDNLHCRYYAIKRIELGPPGTKEFKRKIREVKILKQLKHENIVPYHGRFVVPKSQDDVGQYLEEEEESSAISSAVSYLERQSPSF